jgi:NADH:ubiquinone oxidoreductase subunit E
MTVIDQERLRADVTTLADRLGRHRSSLIPILQHVKATYQGIDSDAMQHIAATLSVHPVEVYSVASFYAFLHPQNEGRFVFRLCRTLSCELQGKEAVAGELRAALGIDFDEASADGGFSLEWANCMGMCDQGPALLVNDRVYTRLTVDKVRAIVADYRQRLQSDQAQVTEEPA